MVLALDVSPWPRPDTDTDTYSDRPYRPTFDRGPGKHQMVPGWPYAIVAALEASRISSTALLDAIRLEPGADLAAVTAAQVHEVGQLLIVSGQRWRGQPDVLVVLDAGVGRYSNGPQICADGPRGVPIGELCAVRHRSYAETWPIRAGLSAGVAVRVRAGCGRVGGRCVGRLGRILVGAGKPSPGTIIVSS